MLNIDDRLIKEISPKIKPNALSVLLAIAIHLSRKNGTCFPSHERLMMLTGLGRDAVYVALKVLKDNGLLITNQAIDSKNKKFGQRTFKVSTKFIKIFIDADEAEPLPEKPYTDEPETEKPYTENTETQLLNESSNELTIKEQINEGGREREVEKTTPTSFDEMMERVNAETRDVEEKEKAPSIADGSPKPFDLKTAKHLAAIENYIEDERERRLSEPTNPVFIQSFDAQTVDGTEITIKTGMNETGETYVFEHTERVTIPANPNATTALFNRMNLSPQATNGDEADAILTKWAAENIETVKLKYNRAKRKFTVEDLDRLIIKFCGQYAPNKDTGTRERFLFDPARFFNDKLSAWLADQPGFEKMLEPKNGAAQETKYTPPAKVSPPKLYHD